MATQGAYSFAADPRAVNHRTRRYREPEMGETNLMNDRRIVRGNTYSAQVVPANAQAEAERLQEEQRRAAQRQAAEQKRLAAMRQPSTPEPVDGRHHMEIQTDNYLEELVDRPPEVDMETQTEQFMDRPPSPLFMPAKEGVDAQTEIAPGDLFDFDAEAEPILEVLIGKTLEQAALEVAEEEELREIQAHKAAFRQRRNAELAEVQRLEAEEVRRQEEKERRVKQAHERAVREKAVRQKVAARSFAKQYLSTMQDRVFGDLAQSGHFYDPLRKEVEEEFFPWVMQATEAHTDRLRTAQALAKALVAATVELQRRKRAALEAEKDRMRKEAEERAAREEEERRKAEEEARLAAEEGKEEGEEGEEEEDEEEEDDE